MNTCVDFLQGTAKCDHCGKVPEQGKEPLRVRQLWNSGWRGSVFRFDGKNIYIGGDKTDTFFCPDCAKAGTEESQ